ncbi:peptidase M48 family protein [Mycobacterium xenopi 4042]|uniref:Peptidase M48 family protein n=1 Tax=Mycobacterium xenopi 4042 TaxID=1299334 RepID=X8AEE5_MYCXE|nr:peptidase M48 family protein [Mycobacterium xenopi 4042]
MVLCVLTITLVCIAVVPALLDRVTPMTSPVVRLTAWLATLVTVLGAVLALPVIAMATGHAATATVVSVPIALLAQGIWRRYTEIMRSTREHAQAVYLISRPANGVRSQTPVVTIDSVLPLVYCLPGHPGLIVTTTAVRKRLGSAELQAVLAHEEAHLRQRHIQLRAMIEAVAITVRWLRFFRRAAERVTAATELCADSAAARRHHPHTLARALLALAPAPPGALGRRSAGHQNASNSCFAGRGETIFASSSPG